jgi:hypothetical protein
METVNHPQHYTECSIECIEAMIIAYGEYSVYEFCKCNAFKYLWRYTNKNGLNDLDKALWYCQKAQEIYKNTSGIGESDPDINRLENIINEHKSQYISQMSFREEKDGKNE